MTLLTIEGFETRGAKEGWNIGFAGWSTGRFGGTAFSGSNGVQYSLPSPTDVVIAGFAHKIETGSVFHPLMYAYDAGSSNPQWAVGIRADRYIEVYRGGSSPVIATSAGPIGTGGEWVYIEVKGRANDATGFVEVKVNGVVVASYTGDTVATTTAGANNGITALTFHGGAAFPLDDVYVCNSLGAAPFNNYLGEIQVETLVPNGNGSYSSWNGSDGNATDNYLLIDEYPANEADYTWATELGVPDIHQYTNPNPALGEILAVQYSVAGFKIYPGPAGIRLFTKTAGGVVGGISSVRQLTNLKWFNDAPQIADPSGAAWTNAVVASTEFGVEPA
jgi:hypothetical protein